MKDTWIVSLADDLVGLCDIICEREDEDAEEVDTEELVDGGI